MEELLSILLETDRNIKESIAILTESNLIMLQTQAELAELLEEMAQVKTLKNEKL